MGILIEILGDPAFLSLLMASRVHQDMLMAFFKALVQRSPILFAPIKILTKVDFESGRNQFPDLNHGS
jgi:hypothetical protein